MSRRSVTAAAGRRAAYPRRNRNSPIYLAAVLCPHTCPVCARPAVASLRVFGEDGRAKRGRVGFVGRRTPPGPRLRRGPPSPKTGRDEAADFGRTKPRNVYISMLWLYHTSVFIAV